MLLELDELVGLEVLESFPTLLPHAVSRGRLNLPPEHFAHVAEEVCSWHCAKGHSYAERMSVDARSRTEPE